MSRTEHSRELRIEASFTTRTFEPLVDQPFSFSEDGAGGSVELRLIEVRASALSANDARSSSEAGHQFRAPFTLTFCGAADSPLSQKTYVVQSEQLGTFQLFIVPIGIESSGRLYEAVFA